MIESVSDQCAERTAKTTLAFATPSNARHAVTLVSLLLAFSLPASASAVSMQQETSICLPDDWQKTLVGKDGSLLYDYPGKFSGFGTRIAFGLKAETQWLKQELASPRVPIVRTTKRAGEIEILEEAFAVAPAAPPVNHAKSPSQTGQSPRHDVLLARLRNPSPHAVTVRPTLTLESASAVTVQPDRMAKGEGIPAQKAQWGFLHSVFPGKIYAPNDPLVQGNMAMLRAVESQGLVFDTGWLKEGIWTYFGGFYGNAWLWLGDGDKAARTLYAFGNHASPLMVWREEQKPVGAGAQVVGDMPHNWASAEFIRLTRHCLALERGNELHLFEGFPAKWAQPGAVTRLRDVMTEFGPLSLEFRIAKDGVTGELRLTPPKRDPPGRIVLHLDRWSGRNGTMELPAQGASTRRIQLNRSGTRSQASLISSPELAARRAAVVEDPAAAR